MHSLTVENVQIVKYNNYFAL